MTKSSSKGGTPTFYKILRQSSGDLVSCVTPQFYSKKDDWVVKYQKSGMTYPKVTDSKLFVFNSLANALAFSESYWCSYANFEVWECNAFGVSTIQPVSGLDNIPDFWHVRKNRKKINYERKHWSGSCSAESVQLTKRLGTVPEVQDNYSRGLYNVR